MAYNLTMEFFAGVSLPGNSPIFLSTGEIPGVSKDLCAIYSSSLVIPKYDANNKDEDSGCRAEILTRETFTVMEGKGIKPELLFIEAPSLSQVKEVPNAPNESVEVDSPFVLYNLRGAYSFPLNNYDSWGHSFVLGLQPHVWYGKELESLFRTAVEQGWNEGKMGHKLFFANPCDREIRVNFMIAYSKI